MYPEDVSPQAAFQDAGTAVTPSRPTGPDIAFMSECRNAFRTPISRHPDERRLYAGGRAGSAVTARGTLVSHGAECTLNDYRRMPSSRRTLERLHQGPMHGATVGTSIVQAELSILWMPLDADAEVVGSWFHFKSLRDSIKRGTAQGDLSIKAGPGPM